MLQPGQREGPGPAVRIILPQKSCHAGRRSRTGLGKYSQASTATDLKQKLTDQPPRPCSLASHSELEPPFQGAVTPLSALHSPSLQTRIDLRAEACSCPAWSRSGTSSGAIPVCRYLLQSGRCRISTETSPFPHRSTDSGTATSFPSLPGTPARLIRINVSQYRLSTAKITLITHTELMPHQG